MKVRVERDVLAEAVAWTARSLPTRPTAPARAGMLLDCGPDGEDLLVLAAVDADVSSRAEIAAEALEPGRAIVSGRLLAEISRALPGAPVQLASDGSKVVLTCGTSKFTLLTLPAEDYLELPDMPPAAGTVAGDVLDSAVRQVAFAAGKEATGLAALTGVKIEIEGETLTLAATDRYRMAVREITWAPDSPSVSAQALIPARTLSEAARSLARTGQVTVGLATTGQGVVGFEGGGWRTTTRLIDQAFPPYRNLLPTSSSTTAVVEAGPFADAVRRVALVADRTAPVRLRFDPGEVRLEAGSGEEAQAVESADAQVDGDGLDIAFNPTYLLDGLGALEVPYARLSFTASTKPAVLTGATAADSEPDADYRYLLMPVRLSG